MVKYIDGYNVNINKNFFNKKLKLILRKIKAPLVVAGLIFTISATGSLFASKEPTYEELCEIVSQLPEENQAEFIDYLNAYRFYEKFGSQKENTPEFKQAARKDLIKESENIEHYLKNILKDKIEEAVVESPDRSETSVKFKEGDGERITVVSSYKGSTTFNNSTLPDEMEKMVNTLYTFENYQGDGTNSKWESEIKNYNANMAEMLKQAATICSTDYDYDGWSWTSHELEQMHK